MKNLLFLFISLILFIYSCSSNDDDTSPPPSVLQTPDPEPITPTKYSLTVTAGEGGTVSNEGGTYDEGTSVTIIATPKDGYVFYGWSDGSTNSSISIEVNQNTTLTANFISINRSVNNPFSEYSLSVLFSEHFAVWWDNNLEIDHTKDANEILKWSEIAWSLSEEFASSYRPSVSNDFYINAYIHHPTYNEGIPDVFPDWGQDVAGQNYGNTVGPRIAYPYDYNIVPIDADHPRMNVLHETYHAIQFDRPKRTITDGFWWNEATASLFETYNLKNAEHNPIIDGGPSLIFQPHYSPWYKPNNPPGPNQWNIWSQGIHCYQTYFFLRHLIDNSNVTLSQILSLQFDTNGEFRSTQWGDFYYYEPWEQLQELVGDEFESIFVEFVKSVADNSFLYDFERDAFNHSLNTKPNLGVQDNRFTLEITSPGIYTPTHLNQAYSWTIVKVVNNEVNYTLIPDNEGSEGTASRFSHFKVVEGRETLIYIICTSDKVSGDEVFDYEINIEF